MALRRALTSTVPTAGRRFMSHGGTQEEMLATSRMWYKSALLGTAFACLPYTLFCLYVETTHEHEHKKFWPHMMTRTKAFPWKKSNCDLMDGACKRAYKNGEPWPPAEDAHH